MRAKPTAMGTTVTQPDPPPPPPRTGPRPLALHLMTAAGFYTSSIAAWNAWNTGSINWTPALRSRAAALSEAVRAAGGGGAEASGDAALTGAVEAEARRRIGLFLLGVERYRSHPYRRADPGRVVAWQEGTTRLLECKAEADGPTPPIILIPSLINRSYILDLMPTHSLAGFLASRGHRVFLVDWGAPGAGERAFGLDAYIGRLARALAAAAGTAGRPVAAVGYCMGGVLALAAALRVRRHVSALAFLATPWDFHAERPDQARALAALLPTLEMQAGHGGTLSVDTLQALFSALDPMMSFRKFADFASVDPEAEAARRFVALEDWLNDGVPLAAPVMRETIGGWYGRNEPAAGRWRPGGQPVDPTAWDGPALTVIPGGDRIVPPGSAAALAEALPGDAVLRPPLGHIGMVTARRAPRLVWDPLQTFLAENGAA